MNYELKQLFSLFLEQPCLLCDRSAKDLICIYCQRKLTDEQLNRPQELWQGDLPVFAWGKYDGQLKRAIAALKYHNQPELGILLGRWLGNAWLDRVPVKHTKLTIIPIPMHQEKLKTRGFNQTVKITQGFCETTGYRFQTQALIRTKQTEAMFGLNPLQRQENIQNAFQIGDKLPKTPVLLLDDIYTTGVTVKEAAKIFRQQNVKVCGIIVLAKSDAII
jgi:ComF family protein